MLLKGLIIDDNIVNSKKVIIFDNLKIMIDSASNMQQALLLSNKEDYQIININEDCINYEQLFPILRHSQSDALISVLSDVPDFEDEITALKLGADYYSRINKDFLRNMARCIILYNSHKCHKKEYKSISKSNILILPEYIKVFINDEYVELTRMEFDLLELLMSDINRVFTYEIIYNHIWNEDFMYDKTVLWSLVNRLRQKIKTKNSDEYIVNVHGLGYRFNRF